MGGDGERWGEVGGGGGPQEIYVCVWEGGGRWGEVGGGGERWGEVGEVGGGGKR